MARDGPVSDPLVSTREAATLHDVAESTIRSWVRRGLLRPVFTAGGTSFYRMSEVDRAEMLARVRDVTGRARRRLA